MALRAYPDRDKVDSSSTLSRHFRTEGRETALATLAELDKSHLKAKAFLTSSPQLEIKYVLRTLRRAANNPTIATKLKNKIKRLDNDTIDALGLDRNNTPTVEAIFERIAVLEHYRKLHGEEHIRLYCGWLRMLYEKYGEFPSDRGRLRSFVVEALDTAGIRSPDPNKNPLRLDHWISTPVEQSLEPAMHRMGAAQAKGLA